MIYRTFLFSHSYVQWLVPEGTIKYRSQIGVANFRAVTSQITIEIKQCYPWCFSDMVIDVIGTPPCKKDKFSSILIKPLRWLRSTTVYESVAWIVKFQVEKGQATPHCALAREPLRTRNCVDRTRGSQRHCYYAMRHTREVFHHTCKIIQAIRPIFFMYGVVSV